MDTHASTDSIISFTQSKLKTGMLDKSLSKPKLEIHMSCFALLFSEIVQYSQKRSNSISDLKNRLKKIGYHVGVKSIDLISLRDRVSKRERETKHLNMLLYIKTQVWKNLFGKEADKLESTDDVSQFYIIEKEPIVNRYISIPKDKGDFNCAEFCGGVIEAVLETTGFPAQVIVQSHGGSTYYIIKFEDSVIQREQQTD